MHEEQKTPMVKNHFLCITSRTTSKGLGRETILHGSHTQSSVDDKNTERLIARLPKLCGQEQGSEKL